MAKTRRIEWRGAVATFSWFNINTIGSRKKMCCTIGVEVFFYVSQIKKFIKSKAKEKELIKPIRK